MHKKKNVFKYKKKFMYSYNKINKSRLLSRFLKNSRFAFFLFLKVIFKSFIKSGNAYRSYKFLSKFSIKIKNDCKLGFFDFMHIIYKKILPVLTFKNKHMGKTKYRLPFKNIGLVKQARIASHWAVTSIKENKSFKFYEKISDEMVSTFRNTGGMLDRKKSYYIDFFKNRNNIRFLRYLKK